MDPTYLRTQCARLANKPEELEVFITKALEDRNYPTIKEIRKREQMSAQKKQYMENFEVAKFLKVIPNPVAHFKINQPGAFLKDESTFNCVCAFLKNEFNMISATSICTVVKKTGGLQSAYKELNRLVKNKALPLLKVKRKHISFLKDCENIPLLQEVIGLRCLTHEIIQTLFFL